MRESDVKREIIRDIRKEGGYARRIEDRFSVGMPDTVLIPMNCPVVWVEVKILTGNILRPAPRQLIELKLLRIPPHSTSFVVGYKEGAYYISPPTDGVHINMCVKRNLAESMGDYIRRALHETF
jgi:hypothetical protein